FLVAGGLGGAEGQVDDRHVRDRHAEGHAGELPFELRQRQTDGFGCAGGGGDDVLVSAAPAAPVLLAGAIDGGLSGGGGVDRRHQAFGQAELLVDHVCNRGEA